MVRIWAKVMSEHKIVKDVIYEVDKEFNIKHFPLYLMDICQLLDLSVPVILSKHVKYYYLFNSTKFTIDDFIGESGFDELVIENASLSW